MHNIARRLRSARAVALVVVAALMAGACSGPAVAVEQSEPERVEAALLDAGEEPSVVACVLRVGRRSIERGPLSDTEIEELAGGCRAARARLDAEDDDVAPPAAPDSVPSAFGDDPDLDRLWIECEGGSGAACDELFVRAPVGTAYEAFGVGCGGVEDVLHCTDLDRTDGDEEPVPLIYRELQAKLAAAADTGVADGSGGEDPPPTP